MKAAYYTLGCKLNYAETSSIAAMLAENGVGRTSAGEAPDLIVVNSCSVTAEADKKCRQLIRSLSRKYPDADIFVTGCYAQLQPHDVSNLPNVAVVVGNDRKDRVDSYLKAWLADRVPQQHITPLADMRSFTPACSRGDRTRYFLKVQDGCDYWCTYCTIPRARGRSRSATIPQLVEMARKVADEGGREIVITGVNIGDFGKGRTDKFIDLIRVLDEVEGIERYRISSIEPDLLTDEIIRFVASSKRFMPHFHIPLQAGTDEVLALMKRHYDTALFTDRVNTIRRLIPDAFIGIDVIAGARGESLPLFEKSCEYIDSLPITRLHVFPYSERPGTRALQIAEPIPNAEKHRRVGELMRISDRHLSAFISRYVGTVRPVLVEHPAHDGSMSGFTDNYLRVRLPQPDITLANTIVNLEVRGSFLV